MSFAAEIKDFTSGFKTGWKMGEDITDAQNRRERDELMASGLGSYDELRREKELKKKGGGPTGVDMPDDPQGTLASGGAYKTDDPVATDLEPEARAFLNVIAGPESAGKYNVRYTPKGGATFALGDQHPGIMEPTKSGDQSSAAGRYQFTKTTWDAITGGKLPFTPENQDRMAWKLAQQDYTARTKRDLLSDLKANNGPTIGILAALAPTWESFKGNIAGRATATYADSLKRYGATQTAGAGMPTQALPVNQQATSGFSAAEPQPEEEDEDEDEPVYASSFAEGGYVRPVSANVTADPARPAGPVFGRKRSTVANPSAGVGAAYDKLIAGQKAAKQALPTAPKGPDASREAYDRMKQNWDLMAYRRANAPQITMAKGATEGRGNVWSPNPTPRYQPQFMSYDAFQSAAAGTNPNNVQSAMYRMAGTLPQYDAVQRYPVGGYASMGFAEGGLVDPTKYRELDVGAGPVHEGTSALWRIEASLGQRQPAAAPATSNVSERQRRYSEYKPAKVTSGKPSKTSRPSSGKAPAEEPKTDEYLDESKHPKGSPKTAIPAPAPAGRAPSVAPGANLPSTYKPLDLPAPPTDLVSDPMGNAVPGVEPSYAPYESGAGPEPAKPAFGPGTAPPAPNQPRDAYAAPSIPGAPRTAIPAPPAPVVEGRGERPGENIRWVPVSPTGEPLAPPQPAPTQLAQPPFGNPPPVATGPSMAVPPMGGRPPPPQQMGRPPFGNPPPVATGPSMALPQPPGTVSPPDQPRVPTPPGAYPSSAPPYAQTPIPNPADTSANLVPPGEIRPPVTPQPPQGPPASAAGGGPDVSPEPWIPQNVPEAAQGTLAQAWAAGRAMVATGTESEEPKQRFYALLDAARAAGVPNSVIEAYAENFGVPPPQQPQGFAEGGLVEKEKEDRIELPRQALPVLPEGRRNAARSDIAATEQGRAEHDIELKPTVQGGVVPDNERGANLVSHEETAEVAKAGLEDINRRLAPQRTTAVGQDPGERQGFEEFVSGSGAPTPDEYKAFADHSDPEGKLSEGDRFTKTQRDLYDFYLQNGRTDKALQMAGAMQMYARGIGQKAGTMAKVAASNGDLYTGAKWLAKAYAYSPDNQEVRVDKETVNDPETGQPGLHYQVVDNESGQVTEDGIATADKIAQMGDRLASGKQWYSDLVKIASGVPMAGRRGMASGMASQQKAANLQEAITGLGSIGQQIAAEKDPAKREALISKYNQMDTQAGASGVPVEQRNAERKKWGLDTGNEPEWKVKRGEAAKSEQAHQAKLAEFDQKGDKAGKGTYLLDYAAKNAPRSKRAVPLGKVKSALDMMEVPLAPEDAEAVLALGRNFGRLNPDLDGAGIAEALSRALEPDESGMLPGLSVNDDGTVMIGDDGPYVMDANGFKQLWQIQKSKKKAPA